MNDAVISNFREICGVNQYFDEKALSKNSTEDSEKTVVKIDNGINEHLNPFEIRSGDSKIPLLNIVSGHVVDESTKEQVLDAKSIGQEATVTYIQERVVERTVSEWDPIKKLNLATFSSDVTPIKTSTKKKEKTKTLKYHQDLFFRLITVSRSRYII